jgi:hypothetical protein
MNPSDEELLAYVDGELDAAKRAALEGEIAADPELATRIAGQRALRERLQRAFGGTLEEPVPPRLVDAARGFSVADIRAARTRKRQRQLLATYWLAAAASLVLGILISPWIPRLAGEEPDIRAGGGSLAASGDLAKALTSQLASEQSPSDRIRLAVSFAANSGEYCRAFVVRREDSSMSGVACREQDVWRIRSLDSAANAPGQYGSYRQAATPLSPLILQAIESSMVGQPLDSPGEMAARSSDWKMPVTAPAQ